MPGATPRFLPCMVWYGMVEVCEGAPVAVSGWVLTMYILLCGGVHVGASIMVFLFYFVR